MLLSFMVLLMVGKLSAQVEECPKYCSPVNNNYGPACGSVTYPSGEKMFRTFPNICELFKQRCDERRFGRFTIDFEKDGPCTSQVAQSRRIYRQSDDMQSPEAQRLELSSDEVQRIYPQLPKKLKALPIERTPSFILAQNAR
ncbi:Hypothetical protein NTJ_09500 [Nesidiocoris tenuis]|uniref:Kazal-like domain-containing protein n=1 Tax=Nesidiocoris tenuis TaxID=355587 RepID=A0ABN7AWY5_9HEMI|nr:Hypothetical protein NTJ_09500 [Nesidiocoris tenuis]